MRSTINAILHKLREAGPGRDIQLVAPGRNGGNLLYYWMWAFTERNSKTPSTTFVEYRPPMDPRLEKFPILKNITITRKDFRFLDRRWLWTRQSYGINFDLEMLDAFCKALVKSSESFEKKINDRKNINWGETVVINVRRGDYYSNPDHLVEYALDYQQHINEAFEIFRENGREFKYAIFVSDDIGWCEENISLPHNITSITPFIRNDLFDDLATLACSHSLILANSTFSYWGSYIASSITKEHMPVAPAHHMLRSDTGEYTSDMFLPTWIKTSVTPGMPN